MFPAISYPRIGKKAMTVLLNIAPHDNMTPLNLQKLASPCKLKSKTSKTYHPQSGSTYKFVNNLRYEFLDSM
jgi:hypothetical protein